MGSDFRGEVAGYYARFRRGYPAVTVDAVVAAFGLDRSDVVLDLGCGTGQLTLPLAGRVGAVIGMDPEPDMLTLARAAGTGVPNVTWVLGADTDVPALAGLLGTRRLGAVTIGTAVHWMRHEQLFAALAPLLRPGGGVAVIANGAPLWHQDSDWSAALRRYLEGWLDRPLTARCGTDTAARAGYRAALRAAGFDLLPEAVHEYTATLDLEHLVGSLYSAMSPDQLPADPARFAEQLARALAPQTQFTEQVCVATLLARLPPRFPEGT
jgi:SAM-dependent methyltransferase